MPLSAPRHHAKAHCGAARPGPSPRRPMGGATTRTRSPNDPGVPVRLPATCTSLKLFPRRPRDKLHRGGAPCAPPSTQPRRRRTFVRPAPGAARRVRDRRASTTRPRFLFPACPCLPRPTPHAPAAKSACRAPRHYPVEARALPCHARLVHSLLAGGHGSPSGLLPRTHQPPDEQALRRHGWRQGQRPPHGCPPATAAASAAGRLGAPPPGEPGTRARAACVPA